MIVHPPHVGPLHYARYSCFGARHFSAARRICHFPMLLVHGRKRDEPSIFGKPFGASGCEYKHLFNVLEGNFFLGIANWIWGKPVKTTLHESRRSTATFHPKVSPEDFACFLTAHSSVQQFCAQEARPWPASYHLGHRVLCSLHPLHPIRSHSTLVDRDSYD